jgi:Co/Zn/Cd efflux system component
LAGFFSGSVALIADGTDASIDTVSACVVWVGIRFKREFFGALVIILMMFATAISVGYDSAVTILEAIKSSISPISMPYLVVVTECVALIAALILSYYQRFVGRKNGSLALISQSIDSKNHIYIAAAVIVGAIFSIAGINFVDALIGGFIAFKILVDGFGLTKEMLQSVRGEETDLSKYQLPFEKKWHLGKLETFRTWILYSIKEDKLNTREALINSLEETFKTGYLPILSEFKFGLGKDYDFEGNFSDLIKPLVDEGYLLENDEELLLTEKGKLRVNRLFRNIRHRQNR